MKSPQLCQTTNSVDFNLQLQRRWERFQCCWRWLRFQISSPNRKRVFNTLLAWHEITLEKFLRSLPLTLFSYKWNTRTHAHTRSHSLTHTHTISLSLKHILTILSQYERNVGGGIIYRRTIRLLLWVTSYIIRYANFQFC